MKHQLEYTPSDDESLLEAIRIIVSSADILPPSQSMDRIVKVIARRNGSKGGKTTLERYGRQHYVDMVNARKDRPTNQKV